MKGLMHDDFLLTNPAGRALFHEVARGLPIVDYHNHLNQTHLATDHRFANLTELWIENDPYKHRAMRIDGVPEAEITGPAPARTKFNRWAATSPRTWGNPLYHWNALEISRAFEIYEPFSPATADRVWNTAAARLGEENFTARSILSGFGVETLCTSDDLLQDLTLHTAASAGSRLEVLPSLRGDTIVNVSRKGFSNWRRQLAAITGTQINNLGAYLAAVDLRLEAFATAGCVLADHAINSGWRYVITDENRAEQLFGRVLSTGLLSEEETNSLSCYLLRSLAGRYAARGWGLQLHIGAQRYTSARLRRLAGGAGGYASIGAPADIESLARFLDAVEQAPAGLPDLILYTLNPADNPAFASLTGAFAQDGRPGKVQFGPAWWYNDQLNGIRDQLTALSSYGLLHHFIGMTTDSRSLLSFSRHEYFRRILCNLLGEWVADGYLPASGPWLEEAVRGICYGNVRRWIDAKKSTHVHETME